MFRRRKIRSLKPLERAYLEEVVNSQNAATGWLVRAKVLLTLADGQTPSEAAKLSMGLLSEEDVYLLLIQFNRKGLNALNYDVALDREERSNFFREYARIFTRFLRPEPKTERRASRRTGTQSRGSRPKASGLTATTSRHLGEVTRRTAASMVMGASEAIQVTAAFFKTKQGRVVIGALILVAGFGIWRLSQPDPFNPGYVALKPSKGSSQSGAESESLNVTLSDSKFYRPIPQFIPSVKLSEEALGSSPAEVTMKNMSTQAVEISFVDSSSSARYSTKLLANDTKIISLPSGTYTTTTKPPAKGDLKPFTLSPGSKVEYCRYATSVPSAILPSTNPCQF
jgi:hypothetical protein